MYNIYILYKNI